MANPIHLVILTHGGTARDALYIARACTNAGHEIEVEDFQRCSLVKG